MPSPLDAKSRQFSLRELFVATTVLCGSFAAARASGPWWGVLFGVPFGAVCVAAWRQPRGVWLAAVAGMGLGVVAGGTVSMTWLQSSEPSWQPGVGQPGDPDKFLDDATRVIRLCVTPGAALGAIAGFLTYRRWGEPEQPGEFATVVPDGESDAHGEKNRYNDEVSTTDDV